ncbi:MAG: MBL fold metallo-hydrolase [Parcubacteria group bacterium]|nr:MBL fold metallo-hydrolase [Parcubacteria group bacterium]
MKTEKLLFLIFIILILTNCFTWGIISKALHIKNQVSFLNVGQGDAELIQTLAGNILIDTGPNAQVLFELGKILPFYDKTIDLVILSHPNKDHFNGLFYLLDKYKIRAVMLNNYTYPASTFQKLIQELQKRNILLIKGMANVRVNNFNNNEQDKLFIVYPPPELFFNNSPNQSCLVAALFLGNNQFLFPGDISISQEKQLLPWLKNLTSSFRILKVAHHGSNTASSENFLNVFHPQISIIEVGENSYGQPHPDILTRLKNISAQVLRTDINGTIQFLLENNALKMKTDNFTSNLP